MQRRFGLSLFMGLVLALGQLSFSSSAAALCLSKDSIASMENATEGKIAVVTTRGSYEFAIAGQCEVRSAFDVWGLETMSDFFVCEGDTVLVYDRATLNLKDSCTILMITEKAP